MKKTEMNLQSRLTLNVGGSMPVLGLGTWQLSEGKEVETAVLWALEAGYRHIDTAKIYGNEQGVGRAIAKSEIPRQEIFVTTKLWNADQGYESALAAIDASLARLKLSYVDLYLVHWPHASDHREEKGAAGNKRRETWQAMEEILKSGKARAIGVSNYTVRHLEEMKTYASVMPAVDQVEFHPFLYQKELLEYCEKNNIVLEAYSPLVHGRRLSDERISTIAKAHHKTNAQVLIRWSLQHGCVVLPKSARKERIKENTGVFDFELAPTDMSALDSLHEDYHVTWNPNNSD